MDVTAMLMANTFTMKGGKDELNPVTLGTGMFLGAVTSFLNHACSPNAEWRPNTASGKMRLVALQKIKVGHSVSISYGDSSKERLQHVYGFACTCERCS